MACQDQLNKIRRGGQKISAADGPETLLSRKRLAGTAIKSDTADPSTVVRSARQLRTLRTLRATRDYPHRYRTPAMAQLIAALVGTLSSRPARMIITFTCDLCSGVRAARGELFAFAEPMR